MENLIYELIEYGSDAGLIADDDINYRINVLAELLGVNDFTISYREYLSQQRAVNPMEKECKPGSSAPAVIAKRTVAEILSDICDLAVSRGMIEEDSITYRDLFDTKVMGAITPPPSEVRQLFRENYSRSSKQATDWYYNFSINTNYIRHDRIVKDEKWVTETEYGPIDISINLSKPEKDPKAIAAAGQKKASGYPACLLCAENEGYAGHVSHPARQNHRIIPITLNGEDYYLQYSPYVYYNEHCIVFNKEHIPMKIDRAVFTKLFDFLDIFPHYIVGSNADLPIVGGSILSHDHFQGGGYVFPMAKAKEENAFTLAKYPDVHACTLNWPMSVVRFRSKNRTQIEEASNELFERWKGYSDETAGIYHHTGDTPHNTVTPIARMRDGEYEIDLVLRNNRTDEEHPWGIFHPTADLHHIKKENIGLIEVMGLAILPARLKKELSKLEEIILGVTERSADSGNQEQILKKTEEALRANELTEKHADWVQEWLSSYSTEELNSGNIHQVVQDEVGKVFKQVLECAGVYKRDALGKAAFARFTDSLNR